MPYYDYICLPCGHKWEIKKAINDPAPSECPVCKCGPVERYHGQETNQHVIYKGKGWMKTDGKY